MNPPLPTRLHPRSDVSAGRGGAGRGLALTFLWILTLPVGANAEFIQSRVPASVDTLSLSVTQASDFWFADVRDAVELRDGSVLVLDAIARHVYRLDEALSEPVPLSTHGEGPGEYVLPRTLRGLTGDSVGLYDGRLSRLTVLDPDGRTARTVRGDGVDRMTGLNFDRLGRGYRVLGAGTPGQRGEPGLEDVDRIQMWDPDLRRWVTAAGVERGVLVDPDRPSLVSQRIMFEPQSTWAVASDGTVAIVTADPYRVMFFDAEQSRVDGPEISFNPIPVTDVHREAWREEASRSRPMVVGRIGAPPGSSRIEMVQLPPTEPGGWAETLPPFLPGTARFAPGGTLWIGRTTEAGTPAQADVFDRRGVRIARVALPEGARIVGFGDGGVYAVVQNEYGEEAVVRLAGAGDFAP